MNSINIALSKESQREWNIIKAFHLVKKYIIIIYYHLVHAFHIDIYQLIDRNVHVAINKFIFQSDTYNKNIFTL